ncbi:MAG TPA: hypothetical protein VME46_05675 [Acidimicrobiales bacterium]|nr:hypothetical protein [Acidimicrobiales bacterium]
MPNNTPSPADRLVSHVLVGLAVGLLVASKTGIVGFLLAGLLAAAAHALLDAPLARLIAPMS